MCLWSQIFNSLRQEEYLSTGVWGQPGQHSKTRSVFKEKKKKRNQAWWLTCVIIIFWKAEVGGLQEQVQLGNVAQNKILLKEGLGR